ncbi:glycosyltransferase family 2 protein [Polaribacter aestuariivivens]|uniref:glycosyltransferase family 2 protein n=1 Tax=Polaribacter aestuariivivens TaxID=2304626 RepID=UPI003F49175C
MVFEYDITATIVLYNEEINTLNKTISCFLKTPLKKRLFLIDNSPTNSLEKHFHQKEIQYKFNGKNIGFGKAHNLAIPQLNSKFHLILNPDIEFKPDIVLQLLKELESNKNVSFITPKVIYPNKKNQFICRKHPTFYDLINRKLNISKKQIFKNEYRNINLENPFYPEFIHGCFMLFKTQDFKKLQGFDERFFLYMEDADLCRKIDKLGKKKLYFPAVEIIHEHQKGSAKSIKLFFYHISSAIKYFLKWGF